MRRAFTILEMLAATALTVLLLAAVLVVIGSLGPSRAALARQPQGGAWRADLLDMLRYDLSNATAVSFRSDAMTLTGHGALDRTTLARRHEPVTVVYELASIRGRLWLVRGQASREGWSGEPGWSELLCPDVSGFTVRAASLAGVPEVEDSRQRGAGQSVPRIVSVLLNGPDGQITTDTLVLR
jgi:type II secretory pathway component PulJ